MKKLKKEEFIHKIVDDTLEKSFSQLLDINEFDKFKEICNKEGYEVDEKDFYLYFEFVYDFVEEAYDEVYN